MNKNNKIHRLPDALVNIIAAGEVVERPASALKEMLENSIDAMADNIRVEIKQGGVQEIKVVDNGSGIHISDAELVLERNATSKIGSKEDLESLYSYGFRGEALASISSISGVTEIVSSTKKSGFRLVKSSEKLDIEEINEREQGTSIAVYQLLEKVPARKKFLKSENTELKHIKDTFIYSAIPHINTHFELYSEGRLIYRLPKTQDIFYRLYEIFGNSITKDLLKNSGGSTSIKIKGYIGKPSLGKKSTKHQYIFINNRFVKSPLIHSAVSQAYSGRMHRDFKPAYFIFLELDPQEFDINVHPRKLEVKFSDEQQIYKSVFSFTQSTLQSNEAEQMSKMLVNDGQTSESTPSFLRDEPVKIPKQSNSQPSRKATSKTKIKQAMRLNRAFLSDMQTQTRIAHTAEPNGDVFHKNSSAKQILNSFIFVKQIDTIVLIDQELASTEIIRERLEKSEVKKDILQNPVLINLANKKDKDRLLKEKEVLAKKLIGLEDFGGQTVQVTFKPDILPQKRLEDFIKKIAIYGEINENVIEKILLEYSRFNSGEALAKEEILLIANAVDNLSNSTFAKLDTVSIKSIIKKY